MPKITRFFIKTAMIYLLIGLLVFGVSEYPGINPNIQLIPVYWHTMALGWITQMIMGVSVWMFPKGKIISPKDGSKIIWISYLTLNFGLIIRIFSEPFLYILRELFSLPYILSIFLQLVGVICFVLEIWPRLQTRASGK